MTLKKFLVNKQIKEEGTSASEIHDLFQIAKRDFQDANKAKGHLSLDWQFGILYNCVLKLCTILLRANGYRTGTAAHHKTTIECLPFILGNEKLAIAKYLDSRRVKLKYHK